MTYLAVVAWDTDFRIAKYQDYLTEAEAVQHVARVLANFPDAFVAEDPGGGFRNWLIDPVAKSLSVVANPPSPGPTNDEIYDQVIQNQHVFKAYVLAVNDGSVVPGSNMTGAALKAAVKAKM